MSLRIATVERIPYSVFVRNASRTPIAYEGYVFDIINMFATHYNLSYEVIVPLDNEFGTNRGNGSWTGMVGQLLRKEVDLAAGFITITEERSDVIDFSVTLSYEGIDILQRHPTKEPNPAALVSPFALETWICILVAIVFSAIVIQITKYVGSEIIHRTEMSISHSFLDGFGGSFYYVGRTFVGQCTDAGFSKALCSFRMCCLTFVLFAFIVTALYTASMTALMTIPLYNVKVRQIDDVTRFDDVQWLVRKGSSLSASIVAEEANDQSLMSSLRKDFEKKKGLFVTGDDEAQEMILRRGFVYLRENTILQAVIKADFDKAKRCRFMLGQGLALLSSEAFGFQKGSKYTKLFDSLAKSMDYHGIMIGAKRRYLPNKPLCPFTVRGSSDARSLGIMDFFATYVTLATGLALSIVLFCLENTCRRCFVSQRGGPTA